MPKSEQLLWNMCFKSPMPIVFPLSKAFLETYHCSAESRSLAGRSVQTLTFQTHLDHILFSRTHSISCCAHKSYCGCQCVYSKVKDCGWNHLSWMQWGKCSGFRHVCLWLFNMLPVKVSNRICTHNIFRGCICQYTQKRPVFISINRDMGKKT